MIYFPISVSQHLSFPHCCRANCATQYLSWKESIYTRQVYTLNRWTLRVYFHILLNCATGLAFVFVRDSLMFVIFCIYISSRLLISLFSGFFFCMSFLAFLFTWIEFYFLWICNVNALIFLSSFSITSVTRWRRHRHSLFDKLSWGCPKLCLLSALGFQAAVTSNHMLQQTLSISLASNDPVDKTDIWEICQIQRAAGR